MTERRDLSQAGIARRLSWTLREKEREEAWRENLNRPINPEDEEKK